MDFGQILNMGCFLRAQEELVGFSGVPGFLS